MLYDDIYAYDLQGNKYAFDKTKTERGVLFTLKCQDMKAISNIYVLGDITGADIGDEGYYVIPRNITQNGDIIMRFTEREEFEHKQEKCVMSLLGIKKKDVCLLVRIERSYIFWFDIKLKNGRYSAEVVFDLENEYIDKQTGIPPEDIRLEVIELQADSDFNDMARLERTVRLERGEITTLAEKCKREAVEYARKYPLVRIRLGWKESPSPVKHQTVETEPPMHVACSFERVRELADEFKRQGLEGVELQLVGWNVSGHDGRYPEIFPPDERLGGEKELLRTVEHVKSLGYRISVHTNAVDAYEIADTFDWDEIAKNKDGGYIRTGDYSGGYPYYICPSCQESYVRKYYPRIRDLGVNGVHYNDVVSVVQPWVCHSELHPTCFKQSLELVNKSMRTARDIFGAISSEGCNDFSLGYIDYGLYVTFGDAFGRNDCSFASEYIPFWEIAYHGIVLYNPMSKTVNYPVKSPDARLLALMRGGKPSIYFYSRFRTGGKVNWMGEVDFTCDTAEDMQRNVALVKQAYEDYKPFEDLQLCFIHRFDDLGNGLECVTYENGTRIIGNFSEKQCQFEGKAIEPYGYLIIKEG